MNDPELFVVRIYRRSPAGPTGVIEDAASGLSTPFTGTVELMRILGAETIEESPTSPKPTAGTP